MFSREKRRSVRRNANNTIKKYKRYKNKGNIIFKCKENLCINRRTKFRRRIRRRRAISQLSFLSHPRRETSTAVNANRSPLAKQETLAREGTATEGWPRLKKRDLADDLLSSPYRGPRRRFLVIVSIVLGIDTGSTVTRATERCAPRSSPALFSSRPILPSFPPALLPLSPFRFLRPVVTG